MKNSHNIFPNIKRRNLIYYALYAGVLIGFAALTVYPDFRKTKQIESNIESVKKKIREQEAFYRQYEMYMAEIRKLDETNYFNFTVRIGSEKCLLSEIQSNVETIGSQQGFAVIFSGVREAPDATVLVCSLTGDFHKLREVLIDFGRLSCLEKIEQIRIAPAGNIPDAQAAGNLPQKEIVLTLRLFRPSL